MHIHLNTYLYYAHICVCPISIQTNVILLDFLKCKSKRSEDIKLKC